MLKSYPKIFAIGTTFIENIFDSEVEISEKVDGSCYIMGKIDGELYMRSKGRQLFPETVDKMFSTAIDYTLSIEDKIEDNTTYYCEYLQKSRHNALKYSRTPKNNLILFGVSNSKTQKFVNDYEELKKYADDINIETVPLLFKGKINNADELFKMLETESVLGGVKIEGVVVKNYKNAFLLGGQPIPLMAGKYVSEKYKEVHRSSWGKEHTGKGRWETFKESYKTEARWDKAIQHLKENGELENSPKDIGKLIVEVQKDIGEECKEEIKTFLWKEFGKELLRYSTKNLPEYYKEKLAKDSFKQQ